MTHTQALYTFYQQWGNNILFKYRKGGKTYSKRVDFFKPSLYVEDDGSSPSGMKSIYDNDLKQIKFNSIKEARDFAKSYADVDNFKIEGNSNFANQFIIEFYQGQMPEFDPSQIRKAILDIEVYSPNEFPDPNEAKHPINGITIYDSFTDTFYCMGMVDYVHDKHHEMVGELKVNYVKFDSEYDLLNGVLAHFAEFEYDLTSGWNSETFDMPYIVRRCYQIVGESQTKRALSPFNDIRFQEFTGKFGKEGMKVIISGLPHLDYLELYRKHIFVPRESYKLGFIGNVELGVGKLSYEEAGTLHNLYNIDPQLFTEYNIQDVAIVKKLDDKLGLFNITFTLAYYTLSNYEDTLGTTKIWEFLVAKYLYGAGKVPRFKSEGRDSREFDGGFVKEVVPGMHDWVFSLDLNGLYPHLEMQVNIGPETHVPRHKLPKELAELKSKYNLEDLVAKRADLSILEKYDLSMAANFEFYRKDKVSFFSAIKDELYANRKLNKKKMIAAQVEAERVRSEIKSSGETPELKSELQKLEMQEVLFNNVQMAMKVALNAGYGALANKHFLYFMVENAEAITTTGQLVNKWTSSRVEDLLKKTLKNETHPYWIAADTDSMYMSVKPLTDVHCQSKSTQETVDLVDQFIVKIIQPKVQSYTDELRDYLNSYANRMVWEREVIAERAIWTAKKRYAMRVWDSEGVRYKNEPYLKITGLEAKKSSTPEWSREFLKECYKIALENNQDKLHAKIVEIREAFYKLDPSDIAIPRGVNGISKNSDPQTLYIKGTPKHCKAAIIHNWLVDQKGLTSVNKIVDGSKIKYITLKKPNPIGQEVIGFETFLPKEFELDRYVDRESIFEDAFLSPLQIFLNAIGWTHEPVVSLDSFFG